MDESFFSIFPCTFSVPFFPFCLHHILPVPLSAHTLLMFFCFSMVYSMHCVDFDIFIYFFIEHVNIVFFPLQLNLAEKLTLRLAEKIDVA